MAESGIKSLVGKKMTKNVRFLNTDIQISKLSVAEVIEIQEKAKALESDQNSGLELLKNVIRMSVEGGSALSDDDFNSFPMDELSKLSNEIMRFSGMTSETGK